MELDRWIGSYKVRSFPWIDGKRIYFNVQYYAPGQSIEKPPVWARRHMSLTMKKEEGLYMS